MRTAYRLALHGLLNLSYTTQDHLLRGGTITSELSPPTSLINQENGPHANLVRTFSQLRALHPK